MNRPRSNPLYSGLITAVILMVLMVGVVISGIPGGPQIPLPWGQKETLHVQLANADALAPHASVEVGGVKVGEVQSVAADGNLALATLEIQPQYTDIHRDATVYLRAHGLFGPKYIAILPGTAGSPQLHDGDTIDVARTVQPVNLDAILQALQAPEKQNLRTFIVEFGKAAAGKGDDVNHLLAAADSLSQVLDTPLKALDTVSPQLSNMLVNNEAFNADFAQAPLDQLVANNERTIKVFADNAAQLQSLLSHANSTLGQLQTDLSGESGNIDTIIHMLGDANNGTIVKLDKFTYLLALFGANLTGQDKSIPGCNPSRCDVTNGIIGAIENVKSAFVGFDTCPAGTPSSATGTNDNHCSVLGNNQQHFLHVRVFNFPPALNLPLPPVPGPTQICLPITIPGQQPICIPLTVSAQSSGGTTLFTGDQMQNFGALFAS